MVGPTARASGTVRGPSQQVTRASAPRPRGRGATPVSAGLSGAETPTSSGAGRPHRGVSKNPLWCTYGGVSELSAGCARPASLLPAEGSDTVDTPRYTSVAGRCEGVGISPHPLTSCSSASLSHATTSGQPRRRISLSSPHHAGGASVLSVRCLSCGT